MKIFTLDGCAMETKAEPPVKRPGFLWTWDIQTPGGTITLKNKCMTCGGKKWLGIVSMDRDKLWSST